MKQTYHRILVPLPDVYQEAGLDTFQELACTRESTRNLVV